MTAAEHLDPALTADATDAAFAAFLAERPQLQRDSSLLPGLCRCPDRYAVEDRPILVRHTVCDNETGTFSWIDLSNQGGPLMRVVDLGALISWIPVPPPAPTPDPGIAVFVIRRMIALGFHLVKLHAGTKRPIGAKWNDPAATPALTAEQAVDHVLAGGNLGVLLGPSNLVVADAENRAAVQALMAAGLRPVLFTAKGMLTIQCDPRYDKRGGGHVWLRVPEAHRGRRLTNIPQASVGDGGLVDVLAAPGSMAVVPPTALIAAGGHAYAADGDHPVWHTEQPADAPEWLFDPAVECPAGLENLRGGLTAKATASGPVSESAAELSSDIDAVSWDQVLALDPEGRLEYWGDEDPECGCKEVHFRGAAHRRSAWLHACERGHYAHFVSETAVAALGLDQRTVSKAQLAAAFLGVSATGAGFHTVAQHLGVELPGKFGDFADALDGLAEKYEDYADDPELCAGSAVPMPDPAEAPVTVTQTALSPKGKPVTTVSRRGGTRWVSYPATAEFWLEQAAKCRATARVLRGGESSMTQADGETFLSEPVIGSEVPPQPVAQPADPSEPIDAETVEVPGQPEPAMGTDLALDDAIEGELVGGVDSVELEKVIRDLRSKIIVIEDQMRALGVPAVQRISDYAESQGVYMHGLTCALLPLAVSSVPPNVVLPARNRQTVAKVMGQGVNIYSVNVAVSSAGKGETENAADAAIPLQQGVKRVGLGTAEYYAKELRGVEDGEQIIHTTSLLGVIDEMDQLNAYLSQPGNKLPGFLTMAYQNGQGGQGTSNKDNSAVLPKHGSRIGFMVNSQPEKMIVLAQHNSIGAEARFIAGNTGLIHPDQLGPLYGLTVAPVMADQSSQPWHHTGHVADPPIPCQQPQSARAAAAAVPNITNIGSHRTEDGEEKKGHRGWDDAPPIWVTLPPKAEAALAESHRISAELAADPTLALKAEVSAHRVVTILHASVGFAVLDGGYNPTDAQWEAAELLVTGSDLVKEMCRAYIALKTQTAAFEEGKIRGAGNAGSRAAEAAITTSALHSAMNGILDRLQKAGGVAAPRDVRNGVTGKFGGLSKSQRNQMYPAFTALERAQRVHLGGDGTWRLGPAPAVITG